MTSGWRGIDLDGTLAIYHGWTDGSVGEPIAPMVERVKAWLAAGEDVRIFTARIAVDDPTEQRQIIEAWCEKHLGQVLPVTNVKDQSCIEIWDDRAVQIVINTGQRVDGCS